jgi:uncharacterized protein (TIGR04255 family)
MTRRVYPKPPIVEAVVEMTFTGDRKGEQALQALGAALAGQYPGEHRQQEVVEMSAEVSPDSVATAARRTPHVTFLRSADGTRLIGCGARTMSVHQLAPYGGWETFLEQIDEAVAALPNEVRKEGLDALSVRYIDRIVLPAGQQSFTDFITIMPPCPAPMPSGVAAFHVVTQTVDPADDTIALLTLASAPPTGEGNPVILYDLHFRRKGNPLCGLDDRTWVTIVEVLHERQRDVFEASITDKLRELFR